MRTAPINIGRCARFLYDDEEENVWKGKKGKICREQKKRFVGDDACIVPWGGP